MSEAVPAECHDNDDATATTVFVFRVGQLGDSLVTLPALVEARKRYPEAPFKLITCTTVGTASAGAWDVLRHAGCFNDVLVYDLRRPLTWIQLARRIRRHGGSKLLLYLAPHRRRSQLRRDRLFFTRACGFERIIGAADTAQPERLRLAGAPVRLEPEWQRLQRIVADGLGTDGLRAATPLLVVPPAARHRADDLLRPLRATAPPIAMAPGSAMPAKRWFLPRYIEIGRRLLEASPDARLVVVGGPEDRQRGERLVVELDSSRALSLAGHTSIIESAAVLERCGAYVGNDTGTMHLAASMGVHCVAIFSARDHPGAWEPFGDGHAVLRRHPSCSGCMLTDCIEEEMRCLDEISVDDVWNVLRGFVA